MKSKHYRLDEIKGIDCENGVIYLKENVTKVKSFKLKPEIYLKIDKYVSIEDLLDKNNWSDSNDN